MGFRLVHDVGKIRFWVLCSIVKKTMANGSVDVFNEEIIQGSFVVGVSEIA